MAIILPDLLISPSAGPVEGIDCPEAVKPGLAGAAPKGIEGVCAAEKDGAGSGGAGGGAGAGSGAGAEGLLGGLPPRREAAMLGDPPVLVLLEPRPEARSPPLGADPSWDALSSATGGAAGAGLASGGVAAPSPAATPAPGAGGAAASAFASGFFFLLNIANQPSNKLKHELFYPIV